mgnify:CR=1 FL=1
MRRQIPIFMRIIIAFLLLLNIYNISFSQSYRTVSKAVSILPEQTFYLNSYTRVGGKARNAVKIEIPKDAIQWSYVFTTSQQERTGTDNLKLLKQATEFVGGKLLGSTWIGLAANAGYQIIKPSGAGVADVYVTDAKGREQFFAESWNLYSYEKPEKTYEGTRENAKDGTIISNDVSKRTLYLCFKNPSLSEGTYITVEAIAIIPTQEFVDEWTVESRDKFYTDCADALRYQPEAVKSVCGCVQSKLTSRYKPSEFIGFTEIQRASQKQATQEECMTLMQTEILSNKNRIKSLEEEIRGLQAVNDYARLALRYQELLELGKDEEAIYYNLSRNLLFIKSFDEAKIQITKAVGKHPKEEALWLNLAHFHLLTNNYREAEPIYLKYKGEKVAKKLRWEEAVAADFRLFEQLGLSNADFIKVKLALGL